MELSPIEQRRVLESLARSVIGHAGELTDLDRAIGDADHGINMQRGFEAVLGELDGLAAKPLGDALQAMGMTLVMKIGGASGPLYGTLFMAIGKSLGNSGALTYERLLAACEAGVHAVEARGKSHAGQKTMLDVLVPVLEALRAGPDGLTETPAATGRRGGAGHRPHARHARAGLVSQGAQHRDDGPGRALERADDRSSVRLHGSEMPDNNVGIVIVSHSPEVARGAADMVRQMVGSEVPLGWCGGNPAGGLGTSVESVLAAIETAWSDRGVAILVDLGGAETNSEMAIELLPPERKHKVVVCNAPIVEGAVMAATEASGGSSLEEVRRTAEELYPK